MELDKLLLEEENIKERLISVEHNKSQLNQTENMLNEQYKNLKPKILEEIKSIYTQEKTKTESQMSLKNDEIALKRKELSNLNDKVIASDSIIEAINTKGYDEVMAIHRAYQELTTQKLASIISLALNSYNNGERNTQDGFLGKGIELSPASRYFVAMEQALKILGKGTDEEKAYAKEFRESLNNEFSGSVSMTSGRLKWQKFPEAIFVSNYGSENPKEVKLDILQEGWEKLYKFIERDDGLITVNVMLDKELRRPDMNDYIDNVIGQFTGKNKEQIYIGFLNKNDRKSIKESPVLLNCDGGFFIDGSYLYDSGCARGGA